jgi:hypothetical protein
MGNRLPSPEELRVSEVTTKAVERTAESIGTDIAGREQTAVEQALQFSTYRWTGPVFPLSEKKPWGEWVKWTGNRPIPAK